MPYYYFTDNNNNSRYFEIDITKEGNGSISHVTMSSNSGNDIIDFYYNPTSGYHGIAVKKGTGLKIYKGTNNKLYMFNPQFMPTTITVSYATSVTFTNVTSTLDPSTLTELT